MSEQQEKEKETSTFEQLNLSQPILNAIKKRGYETPSPVQEECIPYLLAGRDILGQAQTGTGKTAAFALPLLSKLDLKLKAPQVLVLAPTRELALQVAESFQEYASELKGFHVLPIYGGQSFGIQLSGLRKGVQVIVGTPGRVIDHLNRGTLKLDKLAAFVLDEGDEMLNMGFVDDIDKVFDKIPKTCQVALFSATMPKNIIKIARQRLKDPAEIKIKNKTETVAAITQKYCIISHRQKMDVLTRILEVEDFDGMVIFTRTKNDTSEVADKLNAHGFRADALNGDMNQQARERTIQNLKSGRIDILVATDVAARGLDVKRISHVVNYDIPYDPEAYVHRIGRTGRAGREGTALLFVQPRERRLLNAIERATRQKVELLKMPTTGDLRQHRIDQFSAQVLGVIADKDLDMYHGVVNKLMHDHEIKSTDIAAALTWIAQKDRPFIVQDISVPKEQSSRDAGRKRDRGDRGGRGKRRNDRGDRAPRNRKPANKMAGNVKLEQYQITVGRDHQVSPKDIVGAIANEAGVEGKHIGRIDIHNDHSFVDLPEGMPKEVFKHLKKVRIKGQSLNIKKVD